MEVLIVVLLILIATVCALPTLSIKPDPDIMYDLEQFTKCLNKNLYVHDIVDAIRNDPDIRNIDEYTLTDEFKNHVLALNKEPTYLAVLTDLEKHGVPIYENINMILTDFDIDPINQPSEIQEENHNVKSFNALFDKLMTHINEKCSTQVFEDRKIKDPKFKALIDHMHSDEFQKLVNVFKASETLKQTLNAFNAKGLNLDKYVEFLKKLYHYNW